MQVTEPLEQTVHGGLAPRHPPSRATHRWVSVCDDAPDVADEPNAGASPVDVSSARPPVVIAAW